MHTFIAAIRQLRGPLIALATATLVLQTLLAGLTGAQAAARIAMFGADATVFCHGSPGPDRDADDGSAPLRAAHECCVFCTGYGAATLAAAPSVMTQFGPVPDCTAIAASPRDVRQARRAIRAGPSQAPPLA